MNTYLRANPRLVAYAPIDLKKAVLRARDGFNKFTPVVPTVTSNVSIGGLTIVMTGCTVQVPIGAILTVAGDTTEYTVTDRTLSSGTDAVFDLDPPASATYTLTYGGETTDAIPYDALPATVQLYLEALDSVPRGSMLVTTGSGDHLTITMAADLGDRPISGFTSTGATLLQTTAGAYGTGTVDVDITPASVAGFTSGAAVTIGGRALTIKIGEGNCTFSEKKTRQYIKDRGLLDTVRDADEEPMDVSLDFTWEWLKGVGSSGVPTFEDVLKQRGEAATWVTTSSDACEPYCIDLEINYQPTCGGNRELIVLNEFRYETLDHNLKDATVSCTGKCNQTEADVTRFS